MSEKNLTSNIDRLYDAVNGIYKSLQCTICLELMTEPIMTRCGHSFCKLCVTKVLQKKPSTCCLCKIKLDRRNISKDDHLQLCLEIFAALVSAIKTDSGIDILLYSKRPRDTKESCSNYDKQYNSENEKSVTTSNAFSKAGSADNKNDNMSEVKVRTWLHNLPDQLNTNVSYLSADDKVKDKTTLMNQPEDYNKSDATNEIYKKSKSCKTSKKQSSKYIDKDLENASETKKDSQPKKGRRANQSGKIKATDSNSLDELKFSKIPAIVHTRNSRKKDATKSGIEETNNQQNSTMMIEEHDRSSLDTANTSSTNWSSVMEFGKEVRAKKKRMKKLNVSTEKTKKPPEIVENIKLSPNSKYYNLTRLSICNTSGNQANVSNLPEESNDWKQDAIDKNLNLSNTKTCLKASSEIDARNENISFTKDKDSSLTINLPIKASYITLEEGRKVHIMHLNNDQVNEIIGIENSKPKSQHVENQYAKSNMYPDLLLSPRKRLTILTPEKLNESTEECKRNHDTSQASIRNSKNSPNLTIKDQIAELQKNNSVKKTESEVVSSPSPLSGRLSLKKKREVCINQNSPLLSHFSPTNRLLIDKYENDTGDCRNVDSISRNKTQSARMTTVRRHLNLDVVIESTRRSIKNQEHRIKFMQLGTLFRRRNVRYFYLGPTKRERALSAKVEIITVRNMQQSISRQKMSEWHVARETMRELVATPNSSNDSQSLKNITVIENQYFTDNLNANPVADPEDAEFASVASTCKVSATSSSRMDIDSDLSQKKIVATESLMKASKRSTGLADDAKESSPRSLHKMLRVDSSAIRKKTLHTYSNTTNSVKLSPDKDSQSKFLAIDFSTSKSENSKASWIRKQAVIKESNFATSTSMARKSSSKNSNKKEKRMRYAGDDDWCNDDSNILKKRRLSSSDDQDIEVISLNSEDERDVSKKIMKTIMSISSSDSTESKLPENVAGNWKSHKTDRQDALTEITSRKKYLKQNSDDILTNIIDKEEHITTASKIKKDGNLKDRNESLRCLSVKPANHQSSCSTNALEKRKNTKSSEKSFMMKESDMFESNSIFYSDNVDFMLQQMMESSSSKTSRKFTNPSNDDIINRVLQIDRDTPDTCRPLSSAARNDRMSQSKKNSGDYLLENNDETIANVNLPQSDDIISCSVQSVRNHSRMLTEQNTPNCLTMTNEPRGATQETPISVSSTNDIFEHSPRNVRKLSARNALENFDKKNMTSYVHKKRDFMDDRGDEKSVTAKHFVDTIDNNFHREITAKHNVLHEKEKSFNRATSFQTDKGHDVSTNSVGQLNDIFENNTFMNVTQNQANLRMLEEDLFSSPTRKKMQKVASQNDREEQCTPKRRKLNDRDKNAATEGHYAEEDDIVENTPERKRKSNESNVKTIKLRKSTYPSPIARPDEQMPITLLWEKPISKSSSSTFEMTPLDESTPKVARRTVASKQSKENETILSGSVLLPKQTDHKTENINQLLDRQRLCFVYTSLSKVQASFVIEFAAKYNANYVNQFDHDVTHVIVNTNGEQNVAKSTLKYLQGIAHQKWIVSYRWVEDCLKEGKLLNEVPYEATTYNDDGISIEGPRNSRLREKDLFEEFTFLCVGPYQNVSHNQYQDLLRATGATVVDSLEDLAKKEGMRGVVIQDNSHDIETIEHWYHTAKAAPITVEWIVECIGQYKLLKLASQYLSLEDFQAIGYPRELVEEYEIYSDEY